MSGTRGDKSGQWQCFSSLPPRPPCRRTLLQQPAVFFGLSNELQWYALGVCDFYFYKDAATQTFPPEGSAPPDGWDSSIPYHIESLEILLSVKEDEEGVTEQEHPSLYELSQRKVLVQGVEQEGVVGVDYKTPKFCVAYIQKR